MRSGNFSVRLPAHSPGQGFGSKVIDLSIKTQLGGHAHFRWNSDGLNCTLEIPETANRAAPGKLEAPAEEPQAKAIILLVEDEPLVALMIEQLIVNLGHTVAGPYGTVAQAREAIDDEDFTGAILDINLAGELVFPIADILSKRRIPFLFTTGYGPERIVPRFSHIPVLPKPVEAHMLRDFLADTLPIAAAGSRLLRKTRPGRTALSKQINPSRSR
jgi:CheY-like chemotaxis protein